MRLQWVVEENCVLRGCEFGLWIHGMVQGGLVYDKTITRKHQWCFLSFSVQIETYDMNTFHSELLSSLNINVIIRILQPKRDFSVIHTITTLVAFPNHQRMIRFQTGPIERHARRSLDACGTPWRKTVERGIKSGKENIFLTASNSCRIQRHGCLRSPILSSPFW